MSANLSTNQGLMVRAKAKRGKSVSLEFWCQRARFLKIQNRFPLGFFNLHFINKLQFLGFNK